MADETAKKAGVVYSQIRAGSVGSGANTGDALASLDSDKPLFSPEDERIFAQMEEELATIEWPES